LDIDDQNREWFLFAYPLVKNPNDDAQYRVVISALKLPEKEHLRIYPKAGASSSDWMNSQHLQTSQFTNAFGIYIRRDVFGTNGFAYYCSGRVKRIPNPKPDAVQQVGGEEGKLVADLRRILDSIEVLPTNSLSQSLPKPIQETKDLSHLFNAMTPAEIEHVKKGFGRLQQSMTCDECFSTLGVDLKREYPASSWGPPEKQSMSLMLSQGHVLLTVWNTKSGPPRLLAAQLDDLKWPEIGTAQKP
jgi:hypothetical protein